MKFLTFIFASSMLFSLAAKADGVSDQAFSMIPEIKKWLNNKLVVDVVKEQNQRHASIQQDEIDALDKQWRAETKASDKPMIDKVLATELSKYLASVKQSAPDLYTEIFVMDNKGLNVGQSDATSDYWQGDEDKWQKTYLSGPDSVHVAEIEFDESSKKYQSQLSLPIVDSSTGKAIGAVTVGIYVNALLK